MVTKRSWIPVAQINDLSGMTVTLSNITVILININYKTQYSIHYGDKETMLLKYLL